MFISKKDLDNLENKIREEFTGTITEMRTIIESLKKPVQTKKKAVK